MGLPLRLQLLSGGLRARGPAVTGLEGRGRATTGDMGTAAAVANMWFRSGREGLISNAETSAVASRAWRSELRGLLVGAARCVNILRAV